MTIELYCPNCALGYLIDYKRVMLFFMNFIAMFLTILLTPCKQKLVDCVLHNQRLNFDKNYDFYEFLSPKSISEETL